MDLKKSIHSFFKKDEKFLNKSLSLKNYKFFVGILFGLVMFVTLFGIGNAPYGLHVDEAGMAYDAFSLATYGVDRYLNYLPVYLINYGGGQSALYAYLCAVFVRIIGMNIYSIKLPIIVLKAICFLVISKYLRRIIGNKKTLLVLLLFTICPYFILQSRFGLDCNLFVYLLTISICFFLNAIKYGNFKYYILSGFAMGLSLYCYALSYLINPIFLIFTFIYLIYIKKFDFKKIFAFCVPLGILALPLILMIMVNNGYLPQINTFITIPKLPGYRGAEIGFSNIKNNFYILVSILTFDNQKVFGNALVYNSIPAFGTLYYISIPFALIGIFRSFKQSYLSIRNKNYNHNVIFTFIFIAIILVQLIIVNPNINKANGIFFSLIYFIVEGICFCSLNKKLFYTFICLYFVFFSSFFTYFLTNVNVEYKSSYLYTTDLLDALEFEKTLNNSYVYVENSSCQTYIYPLLINEANVYDYYNSKDETSYVIGNKNYIFDFTKYEENGTYIISRNNKLFGILIDKCIPYKVFGKYYVFYSGGVI